MTALMTTDKRDLSASRAKAICDRVRNGIESVAELLIELHDGKGWVALSYKSWKECCEKEFQHSASWACRQIQCHEVNAALPIGTELSEAQARELGKVPEDKREEVLEKAGENPTAKAIKEAADRLDYKCPECGCIECDDDGDCLACHAPADIAPERITTTIPTEREPEEESPASEEKQPSDFEDLWETVHAWQSIHLKDNGTMRCLLDLIIAIKL